MAISGQTAAAPTFSPAPTQYNQQWQSSFLAALQRKLGLLAGPYTIQPQLLLQSPDGTVWQISVSNAGVISATQAVHGTIIPPL